MEWREIPQYDASFSNLPILLLTCLLVHGIGELVNTRGNLQPLVEDTALSLETNILGPFHKSSQVPLRLNVTSYEDNNGSIISTSLFCHSASI